MDRGKGARFKTGRHCAYGPGLLKINCMPRPSQLNFIIWVHVSQQPQTGRLRQFIIWGRSVWLLILVDEVIILAMDFFQRLGLQNLQLVLNSVGCPSVGWSTKSFSRNICVRAWAASVTCHGRFDRNPLRIFDAKVQPARSCLRKRLPLPMLFAITANRILSRYRHIWILFKLLTE